LEFLFTFFIGEKIKFMWSGVFIVAKLDHPSLEPAREVNIHKSKPLLK
jgi:hypothetical protein